MVVFSWSIPTITIIYVEKYWSTVIINIWMLIKRKQLYGYLRFCHRLAALEFSGNYKDMKVWNLPGFRGCVKFKVFLVALHLITWGLKVVSEYLVGLMFSMTTSLKLYHLKVKHCTIIWKQTQVKIVMTL